MDRAALQLARPDSQAYARALIARAYWNPAEEHVAALKGVRSPSTRRSRPALLRLGARASAAFAARDYQQSFDWALTTARPAARDRRSRPPDRDLRGADPVVRADRPLPGTLRLVGAHAELSWRLTPHHRIHSIAWSSRVKELMGEWTAIQERRPVVEHLIEVNLGTPCIRNARSCSSKRSRTRTGATRARRAGSKAGAGDRLRGLRVPFLVRVCWRCCATSSTSSKR